MKRLFYVFAVALLSGASLSISSFSTTSTGSDIISVSTTSTEYHKEGFREVLEKREEDDEEKSWF
ncbi:MAG: hypothetical protein AAGG68_20685 [Bacteroidota bacterium]